MPDTAAPTPDEVIALRVKVGDALAASDCRVEIILAYLHAVATETRDAGAVLSGVRQAAEIVALLDARGVRA